jgi:NhaP-type Na+/H+ or K+/H+ antiporter
VKCFYVIIFSMVVGGFAFIFLAEYARIHSMRLSSIIIFGE